MNRSRLPFVAAGVLALAGCADPQTEPGAAEPAADVVADDPEYQVVATVLEDDEHGPQLCHAIMESLPPRCGGPDIIGWDWDAVEHDTIEGTKMGLYMLVGTWDGERLTLTRPAVADDGSGLQEPDPDPDRYRSPCPEPDGGWRPVDPATTTQAAMDQALDRAATADDYAGGWLDQSYLDGVPEDRLEELGNDPTRLVLNLRFTGDLAQREQWIREVWGGALCLTAAQHTEAELRHIQNQLNDEPDVLGTGVDVAANVAKLQVYVATPERQQQLDERYGEGTVRLDGWLRPVE